MNRDLVWPVNQDDSDAEGFLQAFILSLLKPNNSETSSLMASTHPLKSRRIIPCQSPLRSVAMTFISNYNWTKLEPFPNSPEWVIEGKTPKIWQYDWRNPVSAWHFIDGWASPKARRTLFVLHYPNNRLFHAPRSVCMAITWGGRVFFSHGRVLPSSIHTSGAMG